MELINISQPIIFGETVMRDADDQRAWLNSVKDEGAELIVEFKDNPMVQICKIDNVYEHFAKLHTVGLPGTEIPVTISFADLTTLEVKIKIGEADLKWLEK